MKVVKMASKCPNVGNIFIFHLQRSPHQEGVENAGDEKLKKLPVPLNKFQNTHNICDSEKPEILLFNNLSVVLVIKKFQSRNFMS